MAVPPILSWAQKNRIFLICMFLKFELRSILCQSCGRLSHGLWLSFGNGHQIYSGRAMPSQLLFQLGIRLLFVGRYFVWNHSRWKLLYFCQFSSCALQAWSRNCKLLTILENCIWNLPKVLTSCSRAPNLWGKSFEDKNIFRKEDYVLDYTVYFEFRTMPQQQIGNANHQYSVSSIFKQSNTRFWAQSLQYHFLCKNSQNLPTFEFSTYFTIWLEGRQ